MKKIKILFSLVFIFTVTQVSVCQNVADIEVSIDSVSGNVSVLYGAGGNIGICSGDEGVLVIDTQFAEIYDKIKEAITKHSPGPVKYVFNTNWHYDHVRGNKPFADDGATIIAHKLTKDHMMAEVRIDTVNGEVPVYPPEALPVKLIEDRMILKFNGEDIEIIHIPDAHSDADLIFIFHNANVIHTGDLCFNGGYPFIDVNNGGSIDGMIRAADQVITLMDKETKIIPGHGEIMDVNDVKKYRKTLQKIRDNIQKLLDKGLSIEEIIAARPTAKYDKEMSLWVPAENFVRIVYADLSGG